MKLLILGGTQFLGRHVVQIALERGHQVTTFNRGKTNDALFQQVEKLYGDRNGNLTALKGQTWDAVIDTCGYVPRIVRDSVELLKDSVGHYTFISTISVYADFSKPNMDETADVSVLEDQTVEEVNGETYGGLKALCEQAAESVMPGRVLNVRAGLIVGPNDPTDRFTYWVHRIAAGGDVLAPDNPEYLVQFIDVRDLAAWCINMAERQQGGTFNATGPDYRLSIGTMLSACQDLTQSNAHLVWMNSDFLLENEAQPWSELPLWIPSQMATHAAMNQINISKAIGAGLTFRPLNETLSATWEWDRTRLGDYVLRAGLTREKETTLLNKWSALS
ncbi:MAG: NAD-dependent epimerase/dehydratase family protein [Anaerolineae bacterium]|jgi:2'-hydroxyisoflavone reductase|nr:NAD-dependent epimerase/dehydratase family protein [Anaerolineae bacterium]